jgi:hypothetical protein
MSGWIQHRMLHPFCDVFSLFFSLIDQSELRNPYQKLDMNCLCLCFLRSGTALISSFSMLISKYAQLKGLVHTIGFIALLFLSKQEKVKEVAQEMTFLFHEKIRETTLLL